jgi:hypothetical protein
MIWIDTKEKFSWFLNVLENDELQVVSKDLTERDRIEIRKEINEYKAISKRNTSRSSLIKNAFACSR